jgi:hypothetical protein
MAEGRVAGFLDELEVLVAGFRARHEAMVVRLAAADPSAHGRYTAAAMARGSFSFRRPVTEAGRHPMGSTKFRIQFTIDGVNVGDPIAPPNTIRPYNDVHFAFRPGKKKPKITFTRDGKPIPDSSREAPDGADDVGVEFGEDSQGRPRIHWMHWTKAGREAGKSEFMKLEKAPEDADDFHLALGDGGVITKAWWTHNGHKPAFGGDIEIPNYPVNDVHVVPDARLAAGSIDYDRLAYAVLTALSLRDDYALTRRPVEAGDPPRVPEAWLRYLILYLYAIRETLGRQSEKEKERIRRHLRQLREQVADSRTLTSDEKADLTAKIDEMLTILG